jgi:hypothetical protein
MKIDLKKEATNWGGPPFCRRRRSIHGRGGRPSEASRRRGRRSLLLQITPVNGLAKQGFSATGKWFYRIEVFFEILHRKIIDSNNLL